MGIQLFDCVENIMGKEEIAGYFLTRYYSLNKDLYGPVNM